MTMDSEMRLYTLIAINMAMKMEQIGSAIIQLNAYIKHAEIMTPTLPKVSARICRNTWKHGMVTSVRHFILFYHVLGKK